MNKYLINIELLTELTRANLVNNLTKICKTKNFQSYLY